MSSKTLSVLTILLTVIERILVGGYLSFFIFIPTRIWFILSFQGIRCKATWISVCEGLGCLIQLLSLMMQKGDIRWSDHVLILIFSLVFLALVWYNELDYIEKDVTEAEALKFIDD